MALLAIRRCLAARRYRLTPHFRTRLAQRGLLWADVTVLFDAPTAVLPNGEDDVGRPKWIIRGNAADGLAMGVVCALDHDAAGEMTILITAYFRGLP